MKRVRQFSEQIEKCPKGSTIRTAVDIGEGTVINGPITIKGGKPCIIGKYCGIGDGVRIITSDHRTSYINLNVRLQKEITGKSGHVSKGAVVIGSNVWIGDNAVILSGVSVGNGAVIAAGSIVVSDVPAYMIVGGNPARIIKERFDDAKKSFVDELRWWDWDLERMKRNERLFECDIAELALKEIQRLVVD